MSERTERWREMCPNEPICDAPCGSCYALYSVTTIGKLDVSDMTLSRRVGIIGVSGTPDATGHP